MVNKLTCLIALPLILASPLFGFFQYHEYDFFSKEAASLFLIFAGIGAVAGVIPYFFPHRRFVVSLVYATAILFFFDVQIDLLTVFGGRGGGYLFVAGIFLAGFGFSYVLGKNFSAIATGAFGVYLLSIFMFPVEHFAVANTDHVAQRSSTEIDGKDLPLILHILLDAQIGVEGIPEEIPGGIELKSDLKDYFIGRGFNLYGGAYSQDDNTGDSLARVFSLEGTGSEFEYFRRLSALGMLTSFYGVHQIDFCNGNKYLARCKLENALSVGWIQNEALSYRDKLTVLAKSYLHTSEIYLKLNAELLKLKNVVDPTGNWWPDFNWEDHIRVQPIMAHSMAADLKNDLGKATPGQAYFAHLILPHAPYIYDGNCKLRGLSEWLGVVPITGVNTEQSRRERYEAYFKQVGCAQRVLDRLFDALRDRGLYEGSIIIVHADHGSRLNLVPTQPVTKADFRDRYSVLLAVKLPGTEIEYEPRPVSLAHALTELSLSNFTILPSVDGDGMTQTIFLRGETIKTDFLRPGS